MWRGFLVTTAVVGAGFGVAGCAGGSNTAAVKSSAVLPSSPVSALSAPPAASTLQTTASAPPLSGSPSPAKPSATVAASGFHASGVSFVSATQGWAIGCVAKACAKVEETTDGGATWIPVTSPPGSPSNIRFASATVGYAFDAQPTGVSSLPATAHLTVTHDGGTTWATFTVPASEQVVDPSSLEVSDGTVWALAGVPYPNVDRGPVGGPTLTKAGIGGNRSDSLTVQGDEAYVLGPHEAGPVAPALETFTSSGTRAAPRTLPKECGFAMGDLQTDAGALTPLTTTSHLVVSCVLTTTGGNPSTDSALFRSTDDGMTWKHLATLSNCLAGSLTRTSTAVFAACAAGGIDKITLGGTVTSSYDSNGVSYVGFTNDSDGVAIRQAAAGASPGASQASGGTLMLTRDGGATWKPANLA